MSKVDYQGIDYGHNGTLEKCLARQICRSEETLANVFFGVCPRSGGDGRFDLAWQIRTVRALWSDIDHVTVEESQARVANAGLPQPSIIVKSGNGVHLYWLLEVPYLVSDVRVLHRRACSKGFVKRAAR